MIRLSCPSCDQKLTIDDGHAGKVGKCPACNGKISIPGAAQVRASSGLEQVEDDSLPASKRLPKPKPLTARAAYASIDKGIGRRAGTDRGRRSCPAAQARARSYQPHADRAPQAAPDD